MGRAGAVLLAPRRGGGVVTAQPRGWVVAVQVKDDRRGTWKPAWDGAVFSNKDMARRKAENVRAAMGGTHRVMVLREGIVK